MPGPARTPDSRTPGRARPALADGRPSSLLGVLEDLALERVERSGRGEKAKAMAVADDDAGRSQSTSLM
jgi:hypothetical protein